MKIFDEIGMELEREWRRTNYDSAKFSRLATEALRRRALHRKLSPRDVIEHVLGDEAMPAQFDMTSRFGEPPITMFQNSRFLIDVLFWMNGTTSIHEHSFSGAFQVLSGSSVHGTYRFAPRRRIASAFLLGDVVLEKMELLERGDIRPIQAGHAFIHSLFHLDRPSTTIVVRTRFDPDQAAQLAYVPPTVAFGPFVEDERTTRRAEALGALREIDEEAFWTSWRAHAATTDLPCLFLMMRRHYRTGDLPRMEAVLAAARARHGRVVDELFRAAQTDRRIAWLVARRQSSSNPEHRFFLAVMLNAPDRRTALKLIRRRFPRRDPLRAILRWVEQLAAAPPPAGERENALGLPVTPHTIIVLRHILGGASFAQVLRALEREFHGVREQEEDLRVLYDRLRGHPLFGNWWS